jgi:hypothetical protein
MKLDQLEGPPSDPDYYRRQLQLQTEADKPVIRPEDLSTVADDLAERELQKLCEWELSRREIAFLHLSPRAREKKGWPDLTFALNGRPIAVELKSDGGTLSEAQEAMLTLMKANGWEVYVMRAFSLFNDLLNGYHPAQWEAE